MNITGVIINTSTTTSEFKAIQIGHPTRITHIPYLPNNQIYFRATVNIDNENDILSFGSRLGNFIIKLYGEDFGFGINNGTLRYNVPTGSVHRFYNGATNTVTIEDAGKLKATTFEGLILYLQFIHQAGEKKYQFCKVRLGMFVFFTEQQHFMLSYLYYHFPGH